MGAIPSAFQPLPLPSGTPSAGQVPQATGVGAASAWALALAQQAATPVAGVALVNGTPNILTWTAPNDGLLHRALVIGLVDVTTLEVGGQVTLSWTLPNGNAGSSPVAAAGLAAGPQWFGPTTAIAVGMLALPVKAGTTVTLAQTSALTSGAAVVWAEIWGS